MTLLPYVWVHGDRQDVPDHVVIECCASPFCPRVRRTVSRQPHETGPALLVRVQAQARALATVHGRVAAGVITCIYGDLPESHGADDEWDHRAAMCWLCEYGLDAEVRLMAATTLARLIGLPV